ncbi:MAG: hypothetical protein ACK5Q5_20960 [Planctomycetaceae bacterium]
MEKLSRVLAVVIAVLSVAFMGFAGVVSFGGPNWEAEAHKTEGYTFNLAPGETPIWSATRAAGREELSTKSPLLPEVLTAAIQDRTSRAQAELQQLNEEIPQLEQQTKALAAMQDADVPALDRHFQAQSQRLANTSAQIEQTSQQQKMVADEIRKTEEQLASRREDVIRLELEHRVVTADVERSRQNVAAVEEQIHLLEDELDKAIQRSKELDARHIPRPADGKRPYFPE